MGILVIWMLAGNNFEVQHHCFALPGNLAGVRQIDFTLAGNRARHLLPVSKLVRIEVEVRQYDFAFTGNGVEDLLPASKFAGNELEVQQCDFVLAWNGNEDDIALYEKRVSSPN